MITWHIVRMNYANAAPLEHRKKLGQFFTPPKLASLMADWVMSAGATRVLDPAFGTGTLAAACLSQNPVIDVTAYEIDDVVLEFVPAELRSKVTVNHRDFLAATVDQAFDGVIMNPPYIRHREIEKKEPLRTQIAAQAGCLIPTSANLYMYFILKAISATEYGGRMAFLIPSEWMSANFSKTLKRYLVERKLLREIVTFSNCSNIFDDALTTASLLFLAKAH